MKSLRLLAMVALAAGTAVRLAASVPPNFSGTDSLASFNNQNWTSPTGSVTGSGALSSYSGGVLNFTDSIHTGTSYAYQTWIANTGDPSSDWSVKVDFTLPTTTPPGGQFVSWGLTLGDTANLASTYFRAMIQTSYMGNVVKVQTGSGGSTSTSIGSLTSATMLVTYTASTQTLTAAYEPIGGASFSSFYSESVSGWTGLTSFTAQLYAENTMNAGNTSYTIGSAGWTATASNLVASSTATATTPIPEASTYAALAAIGALGFAAYRRRQKQPRCR